jgi:FkbM family methyltransferase
MLSRWTRAVSYTFSRYVFRRKFLVANARLFGLRFKFRTEDVVGRHIFKRGVHEPDLSKWLLENVAFEHGDVVFDIGANIGWYALLLDRTVPHGVEIFAFEPDAANFALLQENLRLNQARSVVPVNRAVGADAATRTLYRYANKNLGRHSLLPLNDGEQVPVEVTSLDGFVEERSLQNRVPRLIKVDVEGYEFQVLAGATSVLRACDTVLAEYSPGLMQQAGEDPRRLLDLLHAAGFQPYLVDENGLRRTDLESLGRQQDTVDVVWRRT